MCNIYIHMYYIKTKKKINSRYFVYRIFTRSGLFTITGNVNYESYQHREENTD